MTPKILDLIPNRSLLDPNFDGYKLSLNPIPKHTHNLKEIVNRALPAPEQHSYLHAKLFGIHNHLEGEIISNNTLIYYIDEKYNLRKVSFDSLTNELEERIVYTFPLSREKKYGDYNASFKFVGDFAVVSDGMGTLTILETGCRLDQNTWKCVFSHSVLLNEEGFVIQDVVLKETDVDLKKQNVDLKEQNLVLKEKDVNSSKKIAHTTSQTKQLHCLLHRLIQEEDKSSTVLNWITFTQKETGEWGQIALKELSGKTDVLYAYLERNCDALYIISEKSFKCTMDSDNPIMKSEHTKKNEEKKTLKRYLWTQTNEEIVVKFKLNKDFNKEHLIIKTEDDYVCFKYKETIILEGKLFGIVDSSLTTWTVDSSKENVVVEVILCKVENGLMWQKIVPGDVFGDYIVDSTVATEIHERLQHLCSESEVFVYFLIPLKL